MSFANLYGRATVVALGLVLVLGGCGSESADPDSAAEPTTSQSQSTAPDSDETDSGETEGEYPECSDVWVDGVDLPLKYSGCLEDGEIIKPKKRMCGFGRPMVTHDGRFYAMPGNRINDMGDLRTSEQFKQAKQACLG